MHLDVERLERALHGELGSEQQVVQRHLETCVECRLRLEESEREEALIFQRLGTLDHSVPPIPLERVASRPGVRFAWRRLAAGIALVIGAAGAAYAFPGSSLARAFHRAIAELRGERSRPPAAPQQTPAPSPAGIEVPPGTRFTIEFTSAGSGGVARLALTDGPNVVVHALGPASFTSDVDRLSIRSSQASRFEIQIPQTAKSVDVKVSGKPVFSLRSSRVVSGFQRDSSGSYLIPLDRP